MQSPLGVSEIGMIRLDSIGYVVRSLGAELTSEDLGLVESTSFESSMRSTALVVNSLSLVCVDSVWLVCDDGTRSRLRGFE